MGDPKKNKKKYSTPIHPWQKGRIDEEKILIDKYGLKNKKEIWKLASKTRVFARQAKKLIANTTEQGRKEKGDLISKLASLNILSSEANLDDVLGLSVKDLMERRLQTLVYKKGLVKSVKEARQMIVHGHIMVKGKKITVPSYLVKKEEEDNITFVPTSAILKNREETPKEGVKSEGDNKK